MAVNLSTEPDDYRQRLAMMMLQNGTDYSPVKSWTQGASRLANALLGGMELHDIKSEQQESNKRIADLLMGISGAPSATPASAPGNEPPANGSFLQGLASKVGGLFGPSPQGGAAESASASQPAKDMSLTSIYPDQSAPRGFRNNNPGNIEASSWTRNQPGYAGVEPKGRFAQFDTMESGVNAMGSLIGNYGQKGINTISGIISRWAPTSDGNNVGAYASAVAKDMGVSPTTPLNLSDPATQRGLAMAMAKFENGRPVPQGGQGTGTRMASLPPQPGQPGVDISGMTSPQPMGTPAGFTPPQQSGGPQQTPEQLMMAIGQQRMAADPSRYDGALPGVRGDQLPPPSPLPPAGAGSLGDRFSGAYASTPLPPEFANRPPQPQQAALPPQAGQAMPQGGPPMSRPPSPVPNAPGPQVGTGQAPQGPGGGALPQAQPSPMADPAMRARAAAILSDPRADPAVKQMILSQFMPQQKQIMQLPDGSVVGIDPKTLQSQTAFQYQPKPTWGVIGKDQYNNEQYGWIDAAKREATPGPMAAAALAAAASGPAQPGGVPPAPPGADPKKYRDVYTDILAKNNAGNDLPGTSEQAQSMRKEISALPSYKNISEAAPIFETMKDAAARDTRGADVNLIYGMGKIMDPSSAVRESDTAFAEAIASMPQSLSARVKSQLQGTGRLDADVRKQILQEAHSRITAYKKIFDQDAAMYTDIAKRNKLNPDDIIRNFGEFKPWEPAPKPAGGTPTGGGFKIIGVQP